MKIRLPWDIPYKWVIVGSLLFLMTVSHGIIAAGIPVFDVRIIDEFGISRGTLKFRDFIQIFSAGLSGLLIGYAVTWVQPQRICQIGLVFLAATLMAYSFSANIWTIYGLHILLGFCYASAHVVLVVLFVTQWFKSRRALAIGIALSGTSIGSAFFPQVGVFLMEEFGWRGALRGLAIFPLVILPIIFFALKSKPDAIGVSPSAGGRSNVGGASYAPQRVANILNLGDPRRLRELLLLAVAIFGIYYAAPGFIAHTYLHLQDQGFNERTAATGLSIVFITGLVGKVLAGLAAEVWGTRKVWIVHQVMLFTAGLVIAFLGSAWIWFGLTALGFGWAGCYTLTQVMIADRFEGPALAKLVGWFIAFEAVGAGSGSWLTGVMFDRFGSYTVPFSLNCILILLAIVATLFIREEWTVKLG